jgi:hypothetical protein
VQELCRKNFNLCADLMDCYTALRLASSQSGGLSTCTGGELPAPKHMHFIVSGANGEQVAV